MKKTVLVLMVLGFHFAQAEDLTEETVNGELAQAAPSCATQFTIESLVRLYKFANSERGLAFQDTLVAKNQTEKKAPIELKRQRAQVLSVLTHARMMDFEKDGPIMFVESFKANADSEKCANLGVIANALAKHLPFKL